MPEREDDDDLVTLKPGTKVGGRWSIAKELGSGEFGTVFLCKDINDGRHAAMKTESTDADPCIWQEAKIMRHLGLLRERAGAEHFCRCFDDGRDVQRDAKRGKKVSFNYIVMSLTGRGLYSLLKKAGGMFSPGTAIGVSIQLLHALKTLHSIGYLHLDIKPENAAIGRRETNERQRIFLIDFGLARRFISSKTGKHRRQRKKTHFRGTPMYASISAHARSDYCRGDDIESWFYMLVDMYTGSLPWSRVRSEHRTGKMKRRRLSHKPEEVRRKALSDLLQGCPAQLGPILEHIDRLDFYDRPNYEWIETVLRSYLVENGIQENTYDWENAG
ncbi:hypothetical protein niasHT_004770 [Heterodera trifolii]|uniref:Protein kinase domain-containing protein n=1 Tax=Heterodera trifolii TaxID=157864 RepID=A0ABD2M9Q8_9BILA